jgi:hypothetical protein
MANSGLTLIEAMNDPNLFGPWFHDKSWASWRAFLKVLFGICLSSEEALIFEDCTFRQAAPKDVEEVWLIVGRRGARASSQP